jgi:pyruvate/2-oxoglutarate dehydrogenase complex dihydrolipoamide acyltransferase (E2) component
MKSTGIFIGALLGLSFLVSTAMLVTATMKPEWFMFGAKPVQADSLQAHAKKDSLAVRDSSRVLPGEGATASEVPPADQKPSTPPAEAQPSVVEKKNASTASAATSQVPPVTAAKEDDLQNIVKLYEAMKPQDAAKILGKLQDKDVRSIVLHIKKKQAAKILSYFDANRAAQILAQ